MMLRRTCRALMVSLLPLGALAALPVQAATPAPPAAAPAIKASFDCAAAKSKMRLLICSDANVAALDVRTAQLLRRAQARAVDSDGVNADQDVWVHERDACTTIGCLTRAYTRRIAQLRRWTD